MLRNSMSLLISLGLLMALIGCSGSSGGPIIPMADNHRDANKSGTLCLGTWQVAVNRATGELSVYEARGSDLALNVLSFMEPPALKNLSINFVTLKLDDPLLEVDVIFTHPIADPVFTGFDVRGIVFGPDVLNADGYTPYMRPDDFTDVPFGYKDGLLGAPDSYGGYSDELNGYKYFADGLGLDDDLVAFFSNESNLTNRGKFSNGSTNTRHYVLSWEGKPVPLTFLVFNYAVYANYNWPVGEPPITLDDFTITANCQEAFCFNALPGENTLYYFEGEGGGELTLNVELWDWQGFDDYDVAMEAGSIFGTTPVHHDATSTGSTTKSQIFTFTDVPGTPTSTADIPIMITATDKSATFGSSWFMDLFPTSNDLYDKNVYAVWYTGVPVSPESPLSFHVDLEASHTINTSESEVAPGITANATGRIFLTYFSGNGGGPKFQYSDTNGTSWVQPSYSAWSGGYGPPLLNASAIDAEGSCHALVNAYQGAGGWSIIQEFGIGWPNNGIYVTYFTHGNSLIFTSDGYAIPFGDVSNSITYKRALQPNCSVWNGDWFCWQSVTLGTAAPAPANLSHTINAVKTSADDVFIAYFSSSNDKWIKVAHATEDVTPGTWSSDAVYDGTADGRNIARDPSLYYESDGDFHCAFITHDTTPKEYITYCRSTNGLTWTNGVTAYQVSGTNVLDDPTVNTVIVDGHEIVLVTYMEVDKIYLVFTWDQGETWQAPLLLSTGSDGYPDMCSVSNGYAHAVWEHAVGYDSNIEYIRAHFVKD